MSRVSDVIRFYELMTELRSRTGDLRLRDCNGRMKWPARGVYFFFEDGETRSTSGSGPRVARIGTHALTATSSTTLWKRLSQHRGVAGTGGGNHRGSIFRLLVGEALLRKGMHECSSWGKKQDLSAAAALLGMAREAVQEQERGVEQQVSQLICAMPFTWLAIDDPPGAGSSRGYIERNSIALLSNAGKEPVDAPSEDWLGRHSGRGPVRASGLWNNNHVEEPYEPGFLDHLAIAVKSHPAP